MIERFTQELLHLPEPEYDRQCNYFTTFTKVMKNREVKLSDIIQIFVNIISHSQEQEAIWIKNFEKGLQLLREVPLSTPKEVYKKKPILNLHTALIQLSNATNTDEAKRIYWNNQALFWKKLVLLNKETMESLQLISHTLPECEIIKLLHGVPTKHKVYVMETLMDGRMYIQNMSKKYKTCLWALYHSSSDKKKGIEKKLRKLWPPRKYNDFSRRHNFCEYLSNLYSYASFHFHMPETAPLPQECDPNSKDYSHYIDRIVNQANDKFYGDVAQIIRDINPIKKPDLSTQPIPNNGRIIKKTE